MKSKDWKGDGEGEAANSCLPRADLSDAWSLCVHPNQSTSVGFPLHASQSYALGILYSFK